MSTALTVLLWIAMSVGLLYLYESTSPRRHLRRTLRDIRLALRYPAALMAALSLLLFLGTARATEYDLQVNKGYGRLADSEVVKVQLYSLHENGVVRTDIVRMPKPPADYVVYVCIRIAPASTARCFVNMLSARITFIKEIDLNLKEV